MELYIEHFYSNSDNYKVVNKKKMLIPNISLCAKYFMVFIVGVFFF